MRENAVENPVVFRAERAGFFVRKVSWIGRAGAPDRLFARKDRGQVYIEFKRPGGTPDAHQVREHRKMREAGIEVHICDSVEDALIVLGLSNGGPR